VLKIYFSETFIYYGNREMEKYFFVLFILYFAVDFLLSFITHIFLDFPISVSQLRYMKIQKEENTSVLKN